ncbi:diacylglycerol O-acyltransferase, partial [Nocardia cyriacigeorgica]|nr:diacylglycerol O-acyltransferase [Nocardia cyriacigeorgica]
QRRPELATAAPATAPALPWAMQRVIAGAGMAHMSPDIHIGINPGFSRIRAVLGQRIAELTPLSPMAGYSLSVTALILGNKTSFGIVIDPAALPVGYTDTFVEHFDRVLTEAAATSE